MDEDQWPAARFEEHRGELHAVAYRMLGSLAEADDAVQEAWLRLSRSDVSGVNNLGAWLTTVVGRVCLNMLRSRTTRREDPLTPHLPDPIVTLAKDTDPEHQAVLADSVGLALLVALDMLSPAERKSGRATPSQRRLEWLDHLIVPLSRSPDTVPSPVPQPGPLSSPLGLGKWKSR